MTQWDRNRELRGQTMCLVLIETVIRCVPAPLHKWRSGEQTTPGKGRNRVEMSYEIMRVYDTSVHAFLTNPHITLSGVTLSHAQLLHRTDTKYIWYPYPKN